MVDEDGLHNSVVNLPNITHEQLVSFCDRARRSFYLSPRYLYKLKQSLKDRRELQRNVKGFVTLFEYLCGAANTRRPRCRGSRSQNVCFASLPSASPRLTRRRLITPRNNFFFFFFFLKKNKADLVSKAAPSQEYPIEAQKQYRSSFQRLMALRALAHCLDALSEADVGKKKRRNSGCRRRFDRQHGERSRRELFWRSPSLSKLTPGQQQLAIMVRSRLKDRYILFTDDDCVPMPEWLGAMLEPFHDAEVIGVKGFYRTCQKSVIARFVQIEYEDRYRLMAGLPFVDFVDTYSAAFRRERFLEMGGYDTSFPGGVCRGCRTLLSHVGPPLEDEIRPCRHRLPHAPGHALAIPQEEIQVCLLAGSRREKESQLRRSKTAIRRSS